MRTPFRTTRPRTWPTHGSPRLLPAAALLVLLGLPAGPAMSQVQTLGTAPPPSGTQSTAPGPRTVSSKPVNSAPVSSRPLGAPGALPTAPNSAPTVAAGGPNPAADLAGGYSSRGHGGPLPTFASPRRAPSAVPAGGIGTAALPFTDPVIDTQQLRWPIASDRRLD
jgi:hypothetical protein